MLASSARSSRFPFRLLPQCRVLQPAAAANPRRRPRRGRRARGGRGRSTGPSRPSSTSAPARPRPALINADPGGCRADLLGRIWRRDGREVVRGAARRARPGAGGRSFLAGAGMDVARAGEGVYTVETIAPADDGDWTAAVLAAIERPGAAPIAIASISSVHWCDGGLIDLDAGAVALRKRGAALLVDATHSVGVLALDVRTLDPDFVVVPDLQVAARSLRPRLPLRRQAPPGRRSAGADERRPALGARRARRSTSPTPAMSAMRGASTWANATISSPWRWRRSAWR